MIIAVVGMCGSGKSTVCDYLGKQGMQGIYFGQFTMDWLKKRGMNITPANESKARVEIRAKHGMGAYARFALESLKMLKQTPENLKNNSTIFIDGLYSTEEYEVLLNVDIIEKIILVEVYTDKAIRYKRLQSRPKRPFTYKECVERDWSEVKSLNKGGPIALSDYKIPNHGTTQELYTEIDNFLYRIKK